MNPFLQIAGALFPEILKLALGPKGTGVADAAARAVSQVANTADPQKAEAAIKENPELATKLRLDLARIAAEAEAKRRKDELEELKLLIQERQGIRKADAKAGKAANADRAGARDIYLALARSLSPLAWAPVILSIIITVGFFWLLGRLLEPSTATAVANSGDVKLILNIVIGSLVTSFSTVVSFYLGSSTGSRAKDVRNSDLQEELLRQSGEAVKAQSAQAERIATSKPNAADQGTSATALSTARFDACLQAVLGREGEAGTVRGAPGLTLDVLRAWRGPAMSEADLAGLSAEDAKDIYRSFYWNALKCEQMPAGVDLMMFDQAIGGSVVEAARQLQKIVGTKDDGSIGPVTLAAVGRVDAAELIRSLATARISALREAGASAAAASRIDALRDLALGMVAAGGAAR